MNKTKIEYCDFTVNPIRFRNKATGKVGHYCEKISAGCAHCYASRMQTGPYLSGLEFRVENRDKGELFFDESVLQQVLRRRKPATIFWCNCTDLFGDWVPDEWRDRCAATVAMTPHLRHLWLTKRAKRMWEWFAPSRWEAVRRSAALMGKMQPEWDWPPPNLGLGVSVEDQKAADERIPDLLAIPAAMRFVSVEPMLGAVDLSRTMYPTHWHWSSKYRTPEEAIAAGAYAERKRQALISADAVFLDWVICGGESGPGARPMHPDWVRSLRDQCVSAGVPFMFKQWGEYGPTYHRSRYAPVSSPEPKSAYPWGDGEYSLRLGKKAAVRMLDGRVWDERPEGWR